MYSPTKFLQKIESQMRQLYTHARLNGRNHYDTLGITPKATQADIKSAYYKLSMLHHPDKSKDRDEAATKFRDITQAYEVLGNVRTRKLYDKGLLISHIGTSDDIPLHKFYQSRDTKSRPPAPYGRTTVYDFDEWSKAHYGATFQKSLKFKEKERMKKMQEQRNVEDIKQEKVVFLVGLFVLMAAYLFYGREDYDNPQRVSVFGSNIIVTPKSD